MRSTFKRYHRKTRPKQYFKAGGVEATDGPYDTAVHRFMSKDNIERHVKNMKYKKDEIEKKEAEAIREYENLQTKNQAKKDKEFQTNEAKRKENLQERLQAYESQREIDKATAENVGSLVKNSSSALAIVVAWVFQVLEKFLFVSFKGTAGLIQILGFGIDKISATSGAVFNAIMQTVAYNLFKYLFSFIFAILFFVIVIVLLVYGVSIFTKKSDSSSGSGGSNGSNRRCSSLLSDTINLNISDYSKFFSQENVTDSWNKAQYYVPNIPKYDIIPVGTSFWSTAWDYVATTAGIRNPTVRGSIKSLKSGTRGFQRLTRELTGNHSEELVDREKFPTGRCDNEMLIDAKFIKDKKILTDKKLNISNTPDAVINIVKPSSIVWEFPMNEFDSKDFSMLPPTILDNKFYGEKLAIKEKNTIIIPWEPKTDEYRLSCRKAYFKNVTDETDTTNLAHILIDDIGENTCTINNSSKAYKVTQTKERFKTPSKLDAFLT